MSHIYKDEDHCNTNSSLDQEFHTKSPQNDYSHHSLLYKKIRSLIQRTSCFENVENVLVGLSGGVDSSVLLHMLCEFQKNENGPKVFAFHVNHAQRGEESNRDQEIACEIAKHCNCPFEAISLSDAHPGMSEDQLRTLRRHAIETYAQKNNCQRIVLGHHLDDQVETFLFRMIRGADLKGLVGMKPFRDKIVRPLLECSREEIEKEAEGCGLPFIHDSSNFSNAPARNYLRNIVIPALKSKLDPQVSQHLFDLSQSLVEVETLISLQVNETIKQCMVEPNVYSVKKLQAYPSALRKRAIQTMYTYIIKDRGALSRDQIEMIDRWMETTQSPKYLLLPLQIRVEKSKSVLTFSIISE